MKRFSSIAAAVTAAPRNATALICPHRRISLTYAELDEKARRLASGLEQLGYGPGSVLITRLPSHEVDSVLMHLALTHLGAAPATPKEDEQSFVRDLTRKFDVRGYVGIDTMGNSSVVSIGGNDSDGIPLAELLACSPRLQPPAAEERR